MNRLATQPPLVAGDVEDIDTWARDGAALHESLVAAIAARAQGDEEAFTSAHEEIVKLSRHSSGRTPPEVNEGLDAWAREGVATYEGLVKATGSAGGADD